MPSLQLSFLKNIFVIQTNTQQQQQHNKMSILPQHPWRMCLKMALFSCDRSMQGHWGSTAQFSTTEHATPFHIHCNVLCSFILDSNYCMRLCVVAHVPHLLATDTTHTHVPMRLCVVAHVHTSWLQTQHNTHVPRFQLSCRGET